LAKEYESKLKSGDVVGLAEVMRDLHRGTAESERSYSDRQLYAAALDRLSAEVALVEQIPEGQAVLQLESILASRTGRTP
jgi:CarD family transcriptional regulator